MRKGAEAKDKALVVLSGGQDSTTCLFWAKGEFKEVKAISFDYGQRHRIELESARKVAGMAEVEHIIADARFINALTENALTRPDIAVEALDDGLPSTFVDGRNMFFLTMAAVVAKRNGIRNLVTGTCQTDFSGYPDCRQVFLDSLSVTLNLAMDYPFNIYAPLMFLTKAESVTFAGLEGALPALAYSHTCYEGKFPPCGECPACKLRAKGFAEAGVEDPLVRRALDSGIQADR
jgi:7-cyano-7-deazaguanine synthase